MSWASRLTFEGTKFTALMGKPARGTFTAAMAGASTQLDLAFENGPDANTVLKAVIVFRDDDVLIMNLAGPNPLVPGDYRPKNLTPNYDTILVVLVRAKKAD